MDPRDYGEGKTPEQESRDSVQLLSGIFLILGLFLLIVFALLAYHYWS